MPGRACCGVRDLDFHVGAALVAQLNQACIAMGDGELDYIATVRLLERLSGLNWPEAPAAG